MNPQSLTVHRTGATPNLLQAAYDEEFLLRSFAELVRALGHFRVYGEARVHAQRFPDFPSETVFRRFGGKQSLAGRLLWFCREHEAYEDVAAICAPVASAPRTRRDDGAAVPASNHALGSVYLLKAGRFYKIARTNAVGRRERELAIQLPQKHKIIDEIKTDDPAGIEAYWHNRFEGRRGNGEWFALTTEDVAAFRRRKFM